MKSKAITILGGSGFIGSFIVKELVKTGAFIKIASRHPGKVERLKITGNIGQVSFVPLDISNPASVKNAIQNSEIIINLINRLDEKQASSIAYSAIEKDVKQLIHFSTLGVNRCYESKYAQSKYKTEKEILKIFPKAIIIRPGLIFGEGDSFFPFFAKVANFLNILPVIGNGNNKLQLVYAGDIAKAIHKIIDGAKEYEGTIFELACPEAHSFNELMKLVCKATNTKAKLIHIPFWVAKIMAFILKSLPHPIITKDRIRLLKYNNIIHKEDKLLYLSSLNIKPRLYEDVVPKYLEIYKN